MSPKVSVVVTTFNRVKKLKRAIKSVQEQTFQDWEMIIVDDCSTDGTEKTVGKYIKKDARIRYIKRKENFGQHTRPKNDGLKASKADWICYLDDDNAYRKDHIQALWKAMENNPGYDVYYGDRMMIAEDGGELPGMKKGTKQAPGIKADFSIGKLAQMNYIDTSDVLAKKESMVGIGGWDEELPRYADWNLWVRMGKAGRKFLHVPLIISDYYVHTDNNVMKGEGMPFDVANCGVWAAKSLFGKKPKLKVAVFTLTMDRLDYTKRMAKTMKETTEYEFDWFVVDNGSSNETVEWLENAWKEEVAKEVKYNEKNVGISKASNQALDMIEKEGDYDVIIKVDNDCEFQSDKWLETMIDVIERGYKTVVSPYVEGLRDHPGGTPRLKDGFIDKHYVGVVPHLGGICIAAHKQFYKDWRWKEEDFLHGEQDLMFSRHCQEMQGVMVYLENVKIWHIDGTEGQEKKYKDYFKKRKEVDKTTRYEKHKHS